MDTLILLDMPDGAFQVLLDDRRMCRVVGNNPTKPVITPAKWSAGLLNTRTIYFQGTQFNILLDDWSIGKGMATLSTGGTASWYIVPANFDHSFRQDQLRDKKLLTLWYQAIGETGKLFDAVEGAPPIKDGDLNSYFWDRRQIPRGRSRRAAPTLYYVNGMATIASKHLQCAAYLSWLTNSWVQGIFVADSKGSIAEGLDRFEKDPIAPKRAVTIVKQQIRWNHVSGTTKESNAGGRALDVAKCLDDHECQTQALTKDEESKAAKLMLSRVQSAEKLFDQLARQQDQDAVIVAHSRGNLVTSNALWALGILKGRKALSRITVFALASPAPIWPPGIKKIFFFSFQLDPITWVSSPHLLSVLSGIPPSVIDKLEAGRVDLITPDEERQLVSTYRKAGNMFKSLRTYRPQAGEEEYDEVGDYGIPLGHLVWNHCVLNYLRLPKFEQALHGLIFPPPPYPTDGDLNSARD
jgi:hypothetical protein